MSENIVTMRAVPKMLMVALWSLLGTALLVFATLVYQGKRHTLPAIQNMWRSAVRSLLVWGSAT